MEVDFEKLKIAARLGSTEEAAEIWESIKHVVSSASVTTCTVTQRYARDVSEKVPPWDLNVSRRRLVEQLHTVARDILLFAYKAHLKDPGARIERSKETSTTSAALSKPRNRYTEDRLQVARDDVRRASSMSGIKNHTQVLTAWFVQGLFGDRGLEKFYSFQQECIKSQLAKEYTAAQRQLPSTLMDKVLDSYQRICDSAEVTCGQAYQYRLQLCACFFDQLTNLRLKFWQKGSAEQGARLRYADIRSASTNSESACWLKPRLSLQQTFLE